MQFGELAILSDSARLPLRWRATGPGGALFPVLDADLELTALSKDATMLRLTGAYRAPLGKAGAGDALTACSRSEGRGRLSGNGCLLAGWTRRVDFTLAAIALAVLGPDWK